MLRRLALALLLLSAARCGTPTLQARLLNGEKRANQADALLDDADKELAALEPDDAADKLEDARKKLADPDVEYYPEREMIQQRLRAAEARLPVVRKERERRDLELAVQNQSRKLEKVLPPFEQALEALRAKDLDRDAVGDAKDAAEELADALDDGRDLEKKDPAYAAQALKLRARVDHARTDIQLGQRRLAFLDGPARFEREGSDLVKEAKAEKDRARKIDRYQDALERLKRCEEEGKESLATAPGLARVPLQVGAKATNAGAILAACTSQLRLVNARLGQLRKAESAAAARPPPRRKKSK